MNIDDIMRVEEEKEMIKQLQEEEKKLFKEKLSYFESPAYLKAMQEYRECTLKELKDFLINKGFEVIKEDNSEFIIGFKELQVEFEFINEREMSFKIPSRHKYRGLVIEEVSDDYRYRKCKGNPLIISEGEVRYLYTEKVDDIKTLQEKIEALKEDIDNIKQKINNPEKIQFCYSVMDGLVFTDEKFKDLIELFKSV